MIIISILSILLNFSPSAPATDAACNQLVLAISDANGAMTYSNKNRFPVVDSNGKMMFDIGLQRIGNVNRLSLKPVMNCRINSELPVIITFADKTKFEVAQDKGMDSHISILMDDELTTKMMTEKILSITFEGTKYPYNVILKSSQSRNVQDVVNCLQH